MFYILLRILSLSLCQFHVFNLAMTKTDLNLLHALLNWNDFGTKSSFIRQKKLNTVSSNNLNFTKSCSKNWLTYQRRVYKNFHYRSNSWAQKSNRRCKVLWQNSAWIWQRSVLQASNLSRQSCLGIRRSTWPNWY